jgi:hypothetical protein
MLSRLSAAADTAKRLGLYSVAHNGRTGGAPSTLAVVAAAIAANSGPVRLQRFFDSFPVRSKVEQLLHDIPGCGAV